MLVTQGMFPHLYLLGSLLMWQTVSPSLATVQAFHRERDGKPQRYEVRGLKLLEVVVSG